MSKPVVILDDSDNWGEESFFPSLVDAVDAIGDEFRYRFCEVEHLSVLNSEEIVDLICDYIDEQGAPTDVARQVVALCIDEADHLASALLAISETAEGDVWVPAGETLTYSPE